MNVIFKSKTSMIFFLNNLFTLAFVSYEDIRNIPSFKSTLVTIRQMDLIFFVNRENSTGYSGSF